MNKSNFYTVFFHIICWLFVALPMVVFVPPNEEQGTFVLFVRLSFPLLTCALFYINYLWLVPQYFLKDRRNVYFIVNVVAIILFAICSQCLMDFMHYRMSPEHMRPPMGIGPLFMWLVGFVARNVFIMTLSAGIATLMRLAMKWQQTEAERKELEMQKTESELRNLRNQINPHFLLNTLNNIYALIAFNPDKAQKAVLSLSSLLRQMLYGTQGNSISLKTEIEFLHNYIDLMCLRMNKNVKVSVSMYSPNDDIKVAPFIAISLVENAFKHGVSMTEPCFISINITADEQKIVYEITNSNNPKTKSDHSGHGIGLQQVARRLDLAYPGRYEWTKGVDNENKTYTSKIIIYDTKLCYH